MPMAFMLNNHVENLACCSIYQVPYSLNITLAYIPCLNRLFSLNVNKLHTARVL